MNQIPILMYHWFRSADEPSRSRSPQLEITPELFDRHLSLLRERALTRNVQESGSGE